LSIWLAQSFSYCRCGGCTTDKLGELSQPGNPGGISSPAQDHLAYAMCTCPIGLLHTTKVNLADHDPDSPVENPGQYRGGFLNRKRFLSARTVWQWRRLSCWSRFGLSRWSRFGSSRRLLTLEINNHVCTRRLLMLVCRRLLMLVCRRLLMLVCHAGSCHHEQRARWAKCNMSKSQAPQKL
jgi:hypothetical protein